MSFATLSAQLATYLTAAATAANLSVSRAIRTDIVAGEPTTIDRPVIASWYLGTKTWGENTLGATQEAWGFHIRAACPYGTRQSPPPSDVETWVGTVSDAIRNQLYGHVAANSEATGGGMELSDAEAGWDEVNGVRCRVVDMQWWAYMANANTIAA